jgi:hypothetical protein
MQVQDDKARRFQIQESKRFARTRRCAREKGKRISQVTAQGLTVGLEIFDGHKLGGTGVTLGNGFCERVEDVFSDRLLE